ncbi:hypothetical protein JKP88DRAFT_241026 [Tribonema minus]|uniref:Uncharacterized protein n=1 Tax=Tribonema minus TaxID=303371 RepID=A0A836CHR1_9STRA|nr:hypothetical protein JKP88DRAFT_241026 [Tribonema minus]
MIIYASEVAACIGRNSYTSVDAMKKKVWERTDQRSYTAAMKRHSLSLVQDDLPACVNLNAAVACDAKDIPKQVAKILTQPVVPVTKHTIAAAKNATDVKDVIRICKPTVKLDEATDKRVNKAIVDVMEQKMKEAVSVAEVKQATQVSQSKAIESNKSMAEANIAKQATESRQKDAELARVKAAEMAKARSAQAERAERLKRQALINEKLRVEAKKAQQALAEKARAEAAAKREAEMQIRRLEEAAAAQARADELVRQKKAELAGTQALLAEKQRRAELERVATEAFITTAMQTAKVKDCVNLATEVTGTVHKKRGIAGEDDGVRAYERYVKQKVVFKNDKFFKKYIAKDLAVGGRTDGILEDGSRLLEHKKRVNYFYRSNKEKIQCCVYMAITDIHVCDLQQELRGEFEIETYTFDADMWNRICDSLKDFADEVFDIIRSPEKQDALLQV